MEPQFEFPPRHELCLVLSDVSYKPYAGQTPPPREVMPTMPMKGYINMFLCHLYFNLFCITSIIYLLD